MHNAEFLKGLRGYGTERQQEILEAVIATGSNNKASKVLSLNRRAVDHSINGLIKNAAMQGYSPAHDMVHTVPDGFKVKGISTYYNDEGKPIGQWVKSTADDARREQIIKEFIETLTNDVKGLSPLVNEPSLDNKDLLCVYPMGDPHFGMHAWWADAGEDFDLKIAEDLTKKAIDRLISVAPSAETAILLNLGDMFHADNQKNITNSGHQLDVDGRWTKVQKVGLLCMIHCILRLLEKHKKVIFRINRGNHDGHSSYALALMISCYFHNESRVEVDLSPATAWYYQFGKVLIGSTHGDTIKGADMMGIMATDKPKEWGDTLHRYWYVGHVHHQDLKEYRGVVVEYFRTLAARDAWHSGQGYRAGRDMRLIVLHKQHGEIERHRADIGMLES
jgi:hypothetical protein